MRRDEMVELLAGSIRAHIHRRGWTAADLARRAAVDATKLALVLDGHGHACPCPSELRRLALALETTTEQLLAPS